VSLQDFFKQSLSRQNLSLSHGQGIIYRMSRPIVSIATQPSSKNQPIAAIDGPFIQHIVIN